MELVPSKGLHIALNPRDAHRIPRPGKPLWRKREVVRQERTVHYTTVDAEGVLQVIAGTHRGPLPLSTGRKNRFAQ